MPNDVTLNKELGIIEVKAYGTLLPEEMGQAIEEIRKILDRTGVNKILADATRVEQGPDTFDTYDIFSHYPKGFKQAIVLRESDPAGSDARFIENVSVNWGHETKVFDSREEAINWLLEE